VVIVGAGPGRAGGGPGGLERGHQVLVLEAAAKAGGQVRLTAQTARRREMISIIDWRMARCEEQGVQFRFNTLADAARVLAEQPDVVIIATGGLPHTEVLAKGNDLVVSAWDRRAATSNPAQRAAVRRRRRPCRAAGGAT